MRDLYKIVGYVKVDLGMLKHGRHQPYMLGTLILGPKNGMYLLDTYGTSLLIRKVIGYETGLRDEEVIGLMGLPYRTIHNTEESEEATCVKLARAQNWYYYKRSRVAPKINVFTKSLDTEQVDKLHKIVNRHPL